MEGFDKEVCRRLPLAEAALRMLDYVRQDECLKEVFAQHRGRSYENVLTSATLVQLVGDALLEYEGSGRQAIERARETGELKTGSRPVYGKLPRLPLSLSLGLLAGATCLTTGVPFLPPLIFQRLSPPWFAYRRSADGCDLLGASAYLFVIGCWAWAAVSRTAVGAGMRRRESGAGEKYMLAPTAKRGYRNKLAST